MVLVNIDSCANAVLWQYQSPQAEQSNAKPRWILCNLAFSLYELDPSLTSIRLTQAPSKWEDGIDTPSGAGRNNQGQGPKYLM